MEPMKTPTDITPDKKERNPMGTVIAFPNCRVSDELEREVARLDPCEWFVGDRIFHHVKYGQGTVLAVSGQKLIVDFDRAGRKIIWASSLVSLLNGDDGGDDDGGDAA
jgi:hypothetical protein